jgi:predicted transcriptional regulator
MEKRKDNDKCNVAVAIPAHMPLENAQLELGRLSKGLAHPVRVKIITMLIGRPHEDKCYCGDIVKELPLAQSTVSQHLKILKDTGWVQGEIHGPRVCYCLVDGILDYY